MAATKAMHAEGLLRAACTVLSATAALLLGFSAQTKTVLFVEKKAVSKDVQVLWILIIVAGTAAGYHLLRLLKCFYPQNPCWKSRAMAWACFLLDKGWTYVFFGSTIAALQACVVALNGVDGLQWSKLCNIYTRFCDQVAAAILSCLLASAAMAVLSAFSARDLFRLYPSAIAGSAPSSNSE